jgi:hypothetical protein
MEMIVEKVKFLPVVRTRQKLSLFISFWAIKDDNTACQIGNIARFWIYGQPIFG